MHHASRFRDAPRNADFTIDQDWNSYSSAEHDRWDRLFRRSLVALQDRACDEFLAMTKALALSDSGIPDMEKLSDRLGKITGWRVVHLGAWPSGSEATTSRWSGAAARLPAWPPPPAGRAAPRRRVGTSAAAGQFSKIPAHYSRRQQHTPTRGNRHHRNIKRPMIPQSPRTFPSPVPYCSDSLRCTRSKLISVASIRPTSTKTRWISDGCEQYCTEPIPCPCIYRELPNGG
jgi:hypothetical protein